MIEDTSTQSHQLHARISGADSRLRITSPGIMIYRAHCLCSRALCLPYAIQGHDRAQHVTRSHSSLSLPCMQRFTYYAYAVMSHMWSTLQTRDYRNGNKRRASGCVIPQRSRNLKSIPVSQIWSHIKGSVLQKVLKTATEHLGFPPSSDRPCLRERGFGRPPTYD